MRNTLIVLLLSVILCERASSQDSLLVNRLVPRSAIKFSPLHLINFYPTIQFSYEHILRDNLTLQGELGYVLDVNEANTDFQNKRGMKSKLEARYYLWNAGKRMIFYVAVEGYYNAINFDREATRMECFDVDCNNVFTIRDNYKVEYREYGPSMKFGFMLYFDRFFFDINSGWSFRTIRYNDPEAPQNNNFNEFDGGIFGRPRERDRAGVSPVLGIRMGYRLN